MRKTGASPLTVSSNVDMCGYHANEKGYLCFPETDTGCV